MEEKIPDVIFVEQNVVDQFLKKHKEYDVAQRHSGKEPYILAKKALIEKMIKEESERNPVKVRNNVINIGPLHTVERNFREYMIKAAKENNIVYVEEKKIGRYKNE